MSTGPKTLSGPDPANHDEVMLIYDRTVDLRGLANPEPILDLAQAAGSFEDGDTVLVISDDPCFANDLIRWAGGTDLDVVSLHYPAGDLTEVVLRRPGRGRLPLPI